MSYSRAEQQASEEVLEEVNFDPNRLANLVDEVREELRIPDNMPVLMSEVLNHLRKKS